MRLSQNGADGVVAEQGCYAARRNVYLKRGSVCVSKTPRNGIEREAINNLHEHEKVTVSDAASTAANLIDQAGWVMHRRREGGRLRKGEWALLRYLAAMEPVTVSSKDFARYYAVVSRHAADLAGAAETKGLIVREKSAGAAGLRQLKLTAAGRAALRCDPLRALAAALSDVFAFSALEEMSVLLVTLRQALAKKGIPPRARLRGALDGWFYVWDRGFDPARGRFVSVGCNGICLYVAVHARH